MKFLVAASIFFILTLGLIFILSEREVQPMASVPDFSAEACVPSTAQPGTGLLGLAALSVAEPEAQALIVDLAVSLVRVEFRWDYIQPAKGEYDWEKYDEIVDTLVQNNVSILATVNHAPVWAHPIETLADDFGVFLEAFVVRYGDRIDLYEIFNEPNLPGYGWAFESGDVQYDAKLFASILVKANQVIRDQSLDALIISGGLSPDNDPRTFTKHMYEFVAADCFDIFSFHPYGRGERLVAVQTQWETYLAELGDSGKPVWFAEFGTSDEETTATVLRQLDGQMDELNAVIWFSLRDLKPTGWNFGLVEHDWQKKPAYDQFKKIVQNYSQ